MLARSEYIYSIQPRYKFKRRNKKKETIYVLFLQLLCRLSNFEMRMVETKDSIQCIKAYTHTHHIVRFMFLFLKDFVVCIIFARINMILLPSMSHGKRSLWKRLSTVGGALTVPNWLTHLFRLFQVIIVIGFLRILHFLVHLHIIHLNIKYRNIMMRSECSSFFFQNLEFKYRWKKGISRNLTFSFISTLSFYRFYS